MRKINLRAIAALTSREQRKMQDWIDYKLRKYIPNAQQVRARNEQENEDELPSAK